MTVHQTARLGLHHLDPVYQTYSQAVSVKQHHQQQLHQEEEPQVQQQQHNQLQQHQQEENPQIEQQQKEDCETVMQSPCVRDLTTICDTYNEPQTITELYKTESLTSACGDFVQNC